MKILPIILILMLCIPFVTAYDNCNISNISLISGQITDTSFKLFWNTSCATYVSIYQNNVLLSSGYTLNQSAFSELRSNTLYEIMLLNGTCAYIKDVTTKMTSTQQINFYINALLFFFIALGLLIIAVILRTKIIAGLSTMVMLYGFVNSLSSAVGYQLYVVYAFGLLAVIFFLAVI